MFVFITIIIIIIVIITIIVITAIVTVISFIFIIVIISAFGGYKSAHGRNVSSSAAGAGVALLPLTV